mmetsp:Transcript_70238/g.195492  ORF Transcript_70238/g.195492 Transcript_70238/m.195492 type:complete len:152 (+) Transcript_70238:787-1242(+)
MPCVAMAEYGSSGRRPTSRSWRILGMASSIGFRKMRKDINPGRPMVTLPTPTTLSITQRPLLSANDPGNSAAGMAAHRPGGSTTHKDGAAEASNVGRGAASVLGDADAALTPTASNRCHQRTDPSPPVDGSPSRAHRGGLQPRPRKSKAGP